MLAVALVVAAEVVVVVTIIESSWLGSNPGFLENRDPIRAHHPNFVIEFERNAMISPLVVISKNVTYRNRYLADDAILARFKWNLIENRRSKRLPNDSRTLLYNADDYRRHDYVPWLFRYFTATWGTRERFPPPSFSFLLFSSSSSSLLFFSSLFLLFSFFLRRVGTMTGIIRVSSRCYQLRPSSDVTLRISKRFVS